MINMDIKLEVTDKLTEINKSIIRGTDKILDATEKSERSKQLNEVEASAKTLMDFYYRDNVKFKNALLNLSGPEEEKAYQNADDVFAGIYSSDRDKNEYYDAYMKFIDTTLNNNVLVKNPKKYDVFGNYDKLLSEGQTDLSRYKFNDERKELSDKVNSVVGDGYSILRMTMETDIAKHKNLQAGYEAQRNALREQLASADAETAKTLNSQIDDYNNKIENCKNCVEITEGRINRLNDAKKKANDCIEMQEKDITEGDKLNAKADVEDYKYISNMKFTSTRLGKDKVMTQPEYNKEENRVDFKDKYGNVSWIQKD